MKKVFISVGMTGRTNKEVGTDLRRAEDDILKRIYQKKCEDVMVIDNWDCQKPDDAGRLYCLGEAIKLLGDCDICYFVKGWQNYRGCLIERAICELYGIEVMEEA